MSEFRWLSVSAMENHRHRGRYRLSLTEGEKARLAVEAAANTGATYQWQAGRGGGLFLDIENASKPDYEIPSARLADDGLLIRCVTVQGAGIRHSQETRLVVLPRVHPLRRAYTLETLRSLKQSSKDFHQVEFYRLWHLLPKGTRRAVLHEVAEAARIHGKQSLTMAIEEEISPALGRPLHPLMDDYRATQQRGAPAIIGVLEDAGFINSVAVLKERLEGVVKGGDAWKSWRQAGDSEELRREMARALALLDAAEPDEQAGTSREAVESLWAILDTAEWAPLTWRRVAGEFHEALSAITCLRNIMGRVQALAQETGFLDLAMKRTEADGRRPTTRLPPAEAKDVQTAIRLLSGVNPLRYWTAREIREKLEEAGSPRLPLRIVLVHLDDLTGEGALEWRKTGGETEYRLKIKTRFERPRDAAAIFWHGLPRTQLLRSEEFRRFGDTHLLATLWGGAWKYRLAEEAKAAGKIQDDVYASVVEQLLAAYEILRERREAMASRQLLEDLYQPYERVLLVDDPEILSAGLKWLAWKGFAIHQEGLAWAVSGLARKRFLDVFVAGWPEQARKEWEQIRQPSPLQIAETAAHPERPQHMQRRLELILEVNGVSLDDYSEGSQGSEQWNLSRHKPDGLFLDAALYDCGRRLGVEPVLLRTGVNRVQLEPGILRYIREGTAEGKMTLGRRLTILRRLAGCSRAVLAATIGVSAETVGNLETGEVQELHDPRKWRSLADALGVDLFLILSGMGRADAIPSRSSVEERLRLLCQAEGLLVGDLRKDLKGWTAQISRARRGIAAAPVFAQALLAKFIETRPTAEELFGPAAVSVPDAPGALKLRQSTGKFKAKTWAVPETVLRNILTNAEAGRLAGQGLLTIKGYIELCANHADVSEGTFRRTFGKLVKQGHLTPGRPPKLHGAVGYSLNDCPERARPRRTSAVFDEAAPKGL